MSEFHTVCKVEELPEGEAKAVQVNNTIIAVFCDQGEYHAIDDTCPHMGASLCGGHLENGVVTCPWHAWRFSIKDGTWMDNKKLKIGSYPVRVEDGEIQVSVEASPPPEEDSSESQQ